MKGEGNGSDKDDSRVVSHHSLTEDACASLKTWGQNVLILTERWGLWPLHPDLDSCYCLTNKREQKWCWASSPAQVLRKGQFPLSGSGAHARQGTRCGATRKRALLHGEIHAEKNRKPPPTCQPCESVILKSKLLVPGEPPELTHGTETSYSHWAGPILQTYEQNKWLILKPL